LCDLNKLGFALISSPSLTSAPDGARLALRNALPGYESDYQEQLYIAKML